MECYSKHTYKKVVSPIQLVPGATRRTLIERWVTDIHSEGNDRRDREEITGRYTLHLLTI